MEPIETFKNRVPWHGFATDDLGEGLHFMAAPELVKRALVQYQQRHSIGWLVYDLDSDTAMLDWEDRMAPPPNIIAINRDNGHAHLFYALEKPVHDYYGASAAALRYCAAVDLALTDLLGADPGYAKLIAKNPVNDRWLVFTPRTDPYDLEELADWLNLEKYRDKRRRLPTVGLGRNCTLFETLRVWAYRARRRPFLSEEMFRAAVLNHALTINSEFGPPLPHSEVRATVKSIAKWTWRRMSAEGFRAWQRRVGAKGLAAQRRIAEERHWHIIQTADQCPGLTQDEVAAICGCSLRTVNGVLSKARQTDTQMAISDRCPPGGESMTSLHRNSSDTNGRMIYCTYGQSAKDGEFLSRRISGDHSHDSRRGGPGETGPAEDRESANGPGAVRGFGTHGARFARRSR